jgi:hypothetical protein
MYRFKVTCQDGVNRHQEEGIESFANRMEAATWAEWGHVCTNRHTFSRFSTTEPTTVPIEAGNLHVGNVIMLPGDIEVTITAIDWVTDTLDLMTIETVGGREYTYLFSDVVQMVVQ